MTQIAPEIPELATIPELARPMVWTRAMMRAVRSPETHLMGVGAVATCAGAGAAAGLWTLGLTGALGGGLLGGAIGFYLFFRFVLPWQARRLIPTVEKDVEWTAELGDAIRAQERIKSIVAADKHRDQP